MPVRMVPVARLGCHIQTIQPDKSCRNIHDAFQCIRENGYGMRDVIGDHLNGQQQYRDAGHPFLNAEILLCSFQAAKIPISPLEIIY